MPGSGTGTRNLSSGSTALVAIGCYKAPRVRSKVT